MVDPPGTWVRRGKGWALAKEEDHFTKVCDRCGVKRTQRKRRRYKRISLQELCELPLSFQEK